jgi:hypothetical protein
MQGSQHWTSLPPATGVRAARACITSACGFLRDDAWFTGIPTQCYAPMVGRVRKTYCGSMATAILDHPPLFFHPNFHTPKNSGCQNCRSLDAGIQSLGQCMTALFQAFQYDVNNNENGYNPLGVRRCFSLHGRYIATGIQTGNSMTGYRGRPPTIETSCVRVNICRKQLR